MNCRPNLARGLVLSRMSYLMPLWGGAGYTYLNKAQAILNAAARWTTGLTRRTRTDILMERTGWLTIREQLRVATAVLAWKQVYLGKPGRLMNRMTTNENKEIEVQDCRLQFSKDCYRWRAAQVWNDLPQNLREMSSLPRFKIHVKKLQKTLRTRPPDESY